MKKLLFLDNDNEESANKDVDQIKIFLRHGFKLSNDYINSIEIISNLTHVDKDYILNKVFSNEYVICTWSMYTPTHYNSLYQMLSIFGTAARSDIKGIVYLDASGMITDALNRFVNSTDKNPLPQLYAVKNNLIITKDKEGDFFNPVRLSVDLDKGYYNGCFSLTEIAPELLQSIFL